MVHIYEPNSKCASMQWKHPTSLSRSTKNVKVTSLARKFMLTVFRNSQGVLLAHFQKRGENVNSASHCEVRMLRDAIHRKRPGQLARRALLHHDNARFHTARATQERIKELQWELLEHPPYNPDLAPSDFHLCDPLKNDLDGKSFAHDEEVETELRKWLRQQTHVFYAANFNPLVKR
jgi:histone-lysine N-methyltransferase SETMAR